MLVRITYGRSRPPYSWRTRIKDMTRCFTPRACAGRHARRRCRHDVCRGRPIWQLSVNSLRDTHRHSSLLTMSVLSDSEEADCGRAYANTQKNPLKIEAFEEKGSRSSGKRGKSDSNQKKGHFSKNIFCGLYSPYLVMCWPIGRTVDTSSSRSRQLFRSRFIPLRTWEAGR